MVQSEREVSLYFMFYCIITALFNNTRTLKFKTQPTVSFFTAANITAAPQETMPYAMVKRSCLWVVSFCFQGPLFDAIIMIDSSTKRKP